jgi:hypothetical protein
VTSRLSASAVVGRTAGRSLGNVLSDSARKLGIRKSLHGIRKIAAQRCAEAGASVNELNAIFGWSGTKMALRYAEAADRKRLAATGMAKLRRRNKTAILFPHLEGQTPLTQIFLSNNQRLKNPMVGGDNHIIMNHMGRGEGL